MKKFNLVTGIYSIVVSAVLLIAPMVTYATLIFSFVLGSEENTFTGFGIIVDILFRLMALVMIILGFMAMHKGKETNKEVSTAGQVLIILAGFLVVILSSLLGFVSGVLGIIGGVLILASNKNRVVEKIDIELENSDV